jgi:hypothetical protein
LLNFFSHIITMRVLMVTLLIWPFMLKISLLFLSGFWIALGSVMIIFSKNLHIYRIHNKKLFTFMRLSN